MIYQAQLPDTLGKVDLIFHAASPVGGIVKKSPRGCSAFEYHGYYKLFGFCKETEGSIWC